MSMPLKVGDYIVCNNEMELKYMLRELSKEGYHAVRDSVYAKFQIRITGTPEGGKQWRSTTAGKIQIGGTIGE